MNAKTYASKKLESLLKPTTRPKVTPTVLSTRTKSSTVENGFHAQPRLGSEFLESSTALRQMGEQETGNNYIRPLSSYVFHEIPKGKEEKWGTKKSGGDVKKTPTPVVSPCGGCYYIL
jgi:hypothetical protein